MVPALVAGLLAFFSTTATAQYFAYGKNKLQYAQRDWF